MMARFLMLPIEIAKCISIIERVIIENIYIYIYTYRELDLIFLTISPAVYSGLSKYTGYVIIEEQSIRR